MTGHDLDLDAIRHGISSPRDCGVCLGLSPSWDGHDVNAPCRGYVWQSVLPLVAEVESLRVKLEAAEQEREATATNALRTVNKISDERDRAESALAAVRKAAQPLAQWAAFHTANYNGNPPDRQLAISYETAPVTFADLQALVGALAAAEQDEPKRAGEL